MELWIRSQGKTRLSIITNIQLVEWGGEYSLVGYTNDYVDDFDLGTYKTKERALEVLDEIQNILRPQEYYIETGRGTFTETSDISNYVYEMPKD